MEKPDWRVLLLAAVIAAVSGGIVPTLNPATYRPDPFTGKDGERLKEELKEHIRHELHIFELRHLAVSPPPAVRRRIEALEEGMRKVIPGWTPPTGQFGLTGAGPEISYPGGGGSGGGE
jgi:hypothetical protein